MSARVLVVDDEPHIRALLQRLLGRIRSDDAPVAVDVAEDVDHAITALSAEHYDLVLSDYRMPGRDGITLLEAVRTQWPGARRVLMTGYTEEQLSAEASTRADVDAFIRKPWNNRDLQDLIGRLLTGESAPTP